MKLNKKLLEAKEKEEESRLEWQLQVILKCSVAVSGNDTKTAKCTKNISESYRLQSHENEISKNTEMKVAGNQGNNAMCKNKTSNGIMGNQIV